MEVKTFPKNKKWTRIRVQSLALLSESGIWHCCEPRCRSQTWLRSSVAVAKAGSCSSDSTPSLGTSMCRGCNHKNKKKKERKEKKDMEDTEKLVCLELTASCLVSPNPEPLFPWGNLRTPGHSSIRKETVAVVGLLDCGEGLVQDLTVPCSLDLLDPLVTPKP